MLFRAAEWMRARRTELAALEVFEAGQALARRRRRRLRGHRLLRVLRAGGDPPRRGRHGPVAAGRAQPSSVPGTGDRRRHLAVELPAGHTDGHGGRRSGHRQCRAVQAGGADAGGGRPAGRRPERRRPARRRARLPARRGRGGGRLPGRAPRRVVRRLHRLQAGRAWASSRPRPRSGRASATSSGSSPSWAARTPWWSTPTPTSTRRCPSPSARRSATPARSARPCPA